MIIYKCIISGDEMFSNIYKITDSKDGLFYIVEGQQIKRTDKVDESLLGANASAEEVPETNEESSVSGVDIVLNHKLVETFFQKKDYQIYIKEYLKAIRTRLEETNQERAEALKSAAPEAVKSILKNIKNYQFFMGESFNPEGIVGLLDYKEDGITPFMMFFKDGLEVEKC